MLKTFTWNHYLMVVATLTAFYYVIIIIRYYKQSTGQLIRRIWQKEPGIKTFTTGPVEEPISPATADIPQQSSSGTQTPSQVKELMQHLKEAIADAHQQQYTKEDLLLLLEMTLRDYLTLRSTPFQAVINELIRSECSKYGFIHLSVVELEQIWEEDV